jgi:hypothetical protein
MFQPIHVGSAVRQHVSGHDHAAASTAWTPATANQSFSIGRQVDLIKSHNASSGRNLHDAAANARAASGHISTAAEAAAQTAAAGLEMHQSLADLVRTFSNLRRDIHDLLAKTHVT